MALLIGPVYTIWVVDKLDPPRECGGGGDRAKSEGLPDPQGLGQAAYPLHIDKDHGIIPSLFRESLVYLVIVFLLNYLEAGVEGVFHGKEFIASLSSFGQGDPLHILALSIVYWLIVWPYLLFAGLKLALGDTATLQILFGNSKSQS